MEPLVTVVVPTKNSEDLIGNCLKSLRELDYPKDKLEIIVSDGLSSDKTRDIAKSYDAKIVIDYGKSIVSGRNAAFAIAQGELVAITDDDCTFDRNWLRNSLKYFESPEVGGIGGPNLVPENETAFGKAVGLIFGYAPYITRSAHTRILDRVIESRSHGSNAIYRASVLKEVTPVDEILIHGEDVVMNNDIESRGFKLLYVPDVIVNHYRRPTPRKWWRQMFGYGMGVVLVMRKVKKGISAMHVLAGLSVPLLLALVIILASINLWLLLWLAGILLLLMVSASAFAMLKTKSIQVSLNMPFVLVMFFVAWSFGFITETLFPTKSTKGSSPAK